MPGMGVVSGSRASILSVPFPLAQSVFHFNLIHF